MKKIILSAMMLTGMLTFAQDGKLTVSGSVDGYGTYNGNDGYNTGILSDVNTSGFGLGMANTVFSYESGKSGAVIDLAFGPRANAANAYDGPINQLYAYYKVNDKVTLTGGQFNTFFGYEVISPVDNFNYSVSHLFNAGPFSHTGVKIDYAASEDWSFLLAVTNPHALTAGTNPTRHLQVGGQVGYKGQFLNVVYGSIDGTYNENNEVFIDYTGGFDLSESLYLGINAATQLDVYAGLALYLENTVNEKLSLGLRAEHFDAIEHIVPSEPGRTAVTLTGNYKLTENLKTIGEVRFDERNLSTNGHNDLALTMAAVYSF